MNDSKQFKCKSCNTNFIGNDFIEFCPKCNSEDFIQKKKLFNRNQIILLLVLIISISFIIFQNKLKNFKDKITIIQNTELIKHNETELKWENYYEDELVSSEVNHWNSALLMDAMFLKDTTINFFIFSTTENYLSYKKNFWYCNYINSINQNINTKNSKKIKDYRNKLIRDNNITTKEFDELLNYTLTPNNFPQIIYIDDNENNILCDNCIDEFKFRETFDESAAIDFKNFIVEYLTNKKSITVSNQNQLDYYNKDLRKYTKGLEYSMKQKVLTNIEKSKYLKSDKINFVFTGSTEELGSINYEFNSKKYERNRLADKVKDIINEYYENNSLYNGAQPYKYCYGRNPNCTPPYGYTECSSITVKSPYNSDVLVVIKKNKSVYSHGYVKAGRSFTFDVSNGNYNTYFYYGNGWNPNKFMKKTTCGDLQGGFIKNELLNKDDGVRLYNQGVTYELIIQENGNFQTIPSNINEAF